MRHYSESSNKEDIRVLDLGCGWGNNIKFLKDNGFQEFGIDYSTSAVTHCKKISNRVRHGALDDLPYDSNFFDIVIDRRAIQHNSIETIYDIFSEVRRVMKSGGRFLSILAGDGRYSVEVSQLKMDEIKRLSSIFSKIKIDYKTETSNGQEFINTTYILDVIK